MSYKKIAAGSTIKLTWVNSGVTPDSIRYSLKNGAETICSSGTMTSSGNGHYYKFITVTTPGYYVADSTATISSLPFRRYKYIRAIEPEVD